MVSKTSNCLHGSGERLTLYFYGELPPDERRWFEQHLPGCKDCSAALAELEALRSALAGRARATRPDERDWDGFMRRLQSALDDPGAASPTRPALTAIWLGLAAALFLAVALGLVWQRRVLEPPETPMAEAGAGDAALAAAAARHFERAKLVVLGIAMKDPAQTGAADWEYERQLAASLLPETRLFRLSASDHGDARLASLLGDLESVLLQAAMTTEGDAPELQRLQRVIRRRDLLGRMDLREL
jgi:hypothetical protein